MDVNHATALARNTLDYWGLITWRVRISDTRRRIGRCYRVRDGDVPARTIELSRHYIEANTPEVMKDVILHEVAHALTTGGHHPNWRITYMLIGGSGLMTPIGLREPYAGWIIRCEMCRAEIHRLRLSKKLKCPNDKGHPLRARRRNTWVEESEARSTHEGMDAGSRVPACTTSSGADASAATPAAPSRRSKRCGRRRAWASTICIRGEG